MNGRPRGEIDVPPPDPIDETRREIARRLTRAGTPVKTSRVLVVLREERAGMTGG